nr:hypothetical protein [Photobacterium damselae]
MFKVVCGGISIALLTP